MADRLQKLLHLSEETYLLVSAVGHDAVGFFTIMVDRHCQLNGSKVTRTLSHIFFAGGTFEVSVDGTKMRVIETFLPRSKTRFILQFYDVRDMLHVTPFVEYIECH